MTDLAPKFWTDDTGQDIAEYADLWQRLFDIRQGSCRTERKDYVSSLRPNARISLSGHS